MARFGINVAVWRILAVLWQHDDLSHRELSELTSIEVSTLSRISKSVQRDGLIKRKRTLQDQRTVRVTLTEKGRAIVNDVIPWALGTQADMIAGLSPVDVSNLTRILHVIVENLNRFSTDDDLEIGSPAEPERASRSRPAAPARVTPTALARRKSVSAA
nr:MarR family transcriptional regulator [Sphingomonas vulcanisoli]